MESTYNCHILVVRTGTEKKRQEQTYIAV